MSQKTEVKGFRLKKTTLTCIDKIRKRKYGTAIKLNGYIQMILDEHIESDKSINKQLKK